MQCYKITIKKAEFNGKNNSIAKSAAIFCQFRQRPRNANGYLKTQPNCYEQPYFKIGHTLRTTNGILTFHATRSKFQTVGFSTKMILLFFEVDDLTIRLNSICFEGASVAAAQVCYSSRRDTIPVSNRRLDSKRKAMKDR